MTTEPAATHNFDIVTRILVVDDYPPSLYAHARMLREAGFAVVEAADGRTALEIAQREMPNLVLLDVNLPDMHGFEISEKLKSLQATRHIPIVHISATSRGDRMQREAIAAGAAAFIQEPLPPKELLRMIGDVLANAGSGTEPPHSAEDRTKPSRNR